MAKIKFQAYRDNGLASSYVDFRGSNWLGSGTTPEDEHWTIPELQIDNASDEIVALVLAGGPTFNAFLDGISAAVPNWAEGLAEEMLPGTGPIRIGVRIYDDDK